MRCRFCANQGRQRKARRAVGEDMEESSLLDLLECSVCLERLDTTAKVLRCQHTFCRCCLESIVRSRQELRCPECRVLVGCGVEELPANILLVRLLDGIRQRPRVVPDSGVASELVGVGSSKAGSALGLPGFSVEAGSLRELGTSRSVPLAKLNDSAKELIDMDKLCPAAISGCHASLPSDPGTLASMAPRPTLSSTEAVGAFQQCADSRKNAKKRHAFTMFSVIHRSSQATSHRHSMEISAPVLISSSDPRAAARIGDLTHMSCSAPAQDSSPAGSNPVAQQHCMVPKAQLSFNMYLALYAYKPQKNDELELHKATHSSAQDQDRPTTTVSPLRTQYSPFCLPTASLRPHSMVSPKHLHQLPVQTTTEAQCIRPTIPLTSATPAITPPNVTAAKLNGDTRVGTVSGLSTSSPTNMECKPDEKKSEKKEKKSGLLKLLAGTSTKKKSRSLTSISPTHDHQVAVDSSLYGAVGPEVSSLSIHGWAGSCPIDSEIQGAMGMEPLHRKAGSLDLNFSSPSRQAPFYMAVTCPKPKPKPKPVPRERYQVVVSYPPQSEAERELKEGDIVFVHKKHEDGWYKGTLQRNGRTGLFPGSFVKSF